MADSERTPWSVNRISAKRIIKHTPYEIEYQDRVDDLVREGNDVAKCYVMAFHEFVTKDPELFAIEIMRERGLHNAKIIVDEPEPAPEPEYDDDAIPDGEYNDTRVPYVDQVEWVGKHFYDRSVRHKDAPNSLAWNTLVYHRGNAKSQEQFWKDIFPKAMNSKLAKEEAEAVAKKDLATDAMIEQCEQWLMQVATEV
jgi:hypothetical protein